MRKTQTIIIYAGGILLALLACMVIFLNGSIDYFWKLPQQASNILLFPAGLLLFAAVFLAGRGCGKRMCKRCAGVAVLISAAVLAIVQIFLCHQYYIRTGWDADIMFIGAMRLMSGGDLSVIEGYLSQYPNNILLLLVQSFVLKVNAILHIFPEMDGLFSLVAFQCFVVSLTAVLFYDVLRRITASIPTAFGGYAIFWLFFLTSPWTAIPYTDTLGLFVPLLVLELALLAPEKSWQNILRWAVIGGGTYLAYQLKPQLAILTIAAVLVGLTKLIGKDALQTAKRHAAAGTAFVLAFLLFSFAVPRVEQMLAPMQIDEDQNMIPTHYLMMGLNTERDGAYIYDDVELSMAQPNKEARKAENLRVIRERLSAMGAGGLAKHLVKKITSCYADGTFFWGREGNFYNIVPEEKDNALSPLLRNLYLDTEAYGRYYDGWVLFRQAIWCAALLLAAVGALAAKREGTDLRGLAIVFLAIMGLTAFELLFESRARYLYSYLPVYLMAATLGMDISAGKIKKNKEKKN